MGQSDQRNGPRGPRGGSSHAPYEGQRSSAAEAPAKAPSLDLLEGFDGDTEQFPGQPDSGARPLDHRAFDPLEPGSDAFDLELGDTTTLDPIDEEEPSAPVLPPGDHTLRIDLARPAGLPSFERRRPPPLPETKPARPLRPASNTGREERVIPLSQVLPDISPDSELVLRAPVDDPPPQEDDDVIFDIDVVGSREDTHEELDPDEVPVEQTAESPTRPSVDLTVPPPPDLGHGPADDASTLQAPLPVGVSTRDLQMARPRPNVAPPSVRLPCSVLVIDEDRRAGAQIAARLMEVGYTCRVTQLAHVDAVLAQQNFDVALVDVPADEMQRNQGTARIEQMGAWHGPVVLTATGVLPMVEQPMPAQVKAVLSKPLLPNELVRTLEAARSEPENQSEPTAMPTGLSPGPAGGIAGLAAPALPESPVGGGSTTELAAEPSATPTMGAPMVDDAHPNDTLHPIPGALRVLLTRADGRLVRGTVARASYGGRLQLDVRETQIENSVIDVEVILMDGRRSEIPGRASSSAAGVQITLELDPGDVVHFGRFLDEARDASLPAAEVLRARERPSVAEISTGNLDELWMSVQERLDDDAAQQAFIQACLRAQQMDFAIRCYRGLKEERPDDKRVAKYLGQVGTIVGFYALRKQTAGQNEAPLMSTPLKFVLALFLLAAFILIALVMFIG